MAEYQQNNNRPKEPKTLLDDPFLALTAPCPTQAGEQQNRKSKLFVQLRKYNPQSLRNPHIVVKTGCPTETERDTDYGKITAKFDYGSWGTLMETIREAIDWEPGHRESIVTKDTVFQAGGGRSKEALPQATVIIGKDKDGVICMTVKHFKEGRPVIVFKMLPPAQFFDFKNADGSPKSLGDISKRYARSYVKRMEGVVQQLMVDTYEEPAPYDPSNRGGNNNNRGGNGGGNNNFRGNNNGGGGGNGGNGGGGGNNRNDDTGGGGDDAWGNDIPF